MLDGCSATVSLGISVYSIWRVLYFFWPAQVPCDFEANHANRNDFHDVHVAVYGNFFVVSKALKRITLPCALRSVHVK